jgi:hypothetical protein
MFLDRRLVEEIYPHRIHCSHVKNKELACVFTRTEFDDKSQREKPQI